MIRILSISFVLYEKYISATNGEGDRRAEGIICLVPLLILESEIKERSNNKAIINYGKPKFTITSTYLDENFDPL